MRIRTWCDLNVFKSITPDSTQNFLNLLFVLGIIFATHDDRKFSTLIITLRCEMPKIHKINRF